MILAIIIAGVLGMLAGFVIGIGVAAHDADERERRLWREALSAKRKAQK
jgi:hypothetical protein